MTKENAYVNVELNDKGEIKIDTNLGAPGAIHLLASGIQVVTEKSVSELPEPEKEQQ